MFRRGRVSDENPAWPGLVDLYAFTLIIFVFLFVVDKNSTGGEEADLLTPEQRIERLQSDNDALRAEVADLRKRNRDLAAESAERQELASRLKETENAKRVLERENRELNRTLSEQERAEADAIERMRMRAHEEATRLREALQQALGKEWGELDPVHPTLPEFEIIDFHNEPILFEQAKHALTDRYKSYVTELSDALARVLVSFPDAEIEVRGTADPDPYRGRGEIKDNIDLSAMRAATVAKLLNAPGATATAPSAKKNLIIVGLGEVGEAIEDPVQKKEEYRQYRRVRLKIRIPLARIAES